MKLLCCVLISCLVFEEMPYSLPLWLHHFTFSLEHWFFCLTWRLNRKNLWTMIFCLDPWLQLMVCWNCSRWSVRFLSSREFFWAFCQIKGLYSTVCFFCKVSRLALRTQVPHRISILTVILISFRMRKLRPKCLNGSYLVSMTDQIYSPGPLISFLKAASPLSSCCCLVTKSCPTLCDPMDSSTPAFPVLYYLSEFGQTHVH